MRKWINIEAEGLPIRYVALKIKDEDGEITDAVLINHFPPIFADDNGFEYRAVEWWSYE